MQPTASSHRYFNAKTSSILHEVYTNKVRCDLAQEEEVVTVIVFLGFHTWVFYFRFDVRT